MLRGIRLFMHALSLTQQGQIGGELIILTGVVIMLTRCAEKHRKKLVFDNGNEKFNNVGKKVQMNIR